jgi:ketosteroid isomerase-like protein
MVDVDGHGELAYTRGTYSLTMQPAGAAPMSDTGKFVEVWRKQPDGSWKIKWDIYNSDNPPPPAPTTSTGKS